MIPVRQTGPITTGVQNEKCRIPVSTKHKIEDPRTGRPFTLPKAVKVLVLESIVIVCLPVVRVEGAGSIQIGTPSS